MPLPEAFYSPNPRCVADFFWLYFAIPDVSTPSSPYGVFRVFIREKLILNMFLFAIYVNI